jgi:peptidyl-prolyl cis-trans isomerase SurA
MRVPGIFAASWVMAAAPVFAEEDLVDGIAAQVGDEIVLVSEVLETVSSTETRMRAAGLPASEIAKLRADGLESLIETHLIEQMVRQTELYASDAEVDRAIELIAKENGLSPDQLRASVERQGLPFDAYQEKIKGELERRKVIQALVTPKVRVEEFEVRALYDARFAEQPEGGEQFHIRQLLVTHGEAADRSPAQACALAKNAIDRISEGESFEKVASEVSDVSRNRGGDIGWLHSDSLAPWMSKAVAGLAPGETTELLELPFGCCVLKVVERRLFIQVSYETAKPDLQQEIYQQKVSDELRDWLEELREKTFIERRGHFADAATFRRPAGGAGVEPGS